MKHARRDYDRIQDPAVKNPSLIGPGCTPIAQDEPVFLLRAQDRTAAKVVRFWAWYNSLDADSDKEAIKLAEQHAKLMDQWPKKKAADVPR